ncbi:MAG TPA: YicC/YloC family endoribonuclease [Gemmatimonadaceae bacterium]|nr:YicC/YloC family endoribonuclease [Gemmatimonadaceae bacterium]
MIQSMTGYGTADGEVGGVPVTVEIRAVNHRFFNPSVKLPSRFGAWEGDVREALRRSISRGHVTLTARIGVREATAVALAVDEARAAAYVAQLRALGERLGISGDVDFPTLLRLPDVIAMPQELDAGGSASELLAIVERAVDALTAARTAEGERLVAFLQERLAAVAAAVDRIAERAPLRVVEQRDRLRANVRELADGVVVDEQRLALEIAILADRLDVQEELERFRSHLAAFREALATDGGGEPVGKRLGFLLQELLREANTTGSKGNDVAVVRDVLLIKEELERLREQVENLA